MSCTFSIFSLGYNFMTSSKLGIKQLMPYLCCCLSIMKCEIRKFWNEFRDWCLLNMKKLSKNYLHDVPFCKSSVINSSPLIIIMSCKTLLDWIPSSLYTHHLLFLVFNKFSKPNHTSRLLYFFIFCL